MNNEAWHTSDSVSCSSRIRDLNKLRRLLLRKCHFKIDHCDHILRVLQFFHVGHIVSNRRSVVLFAWQEWFSCNGRESTAVSLRCRQKLKCENFTSSFGRLNSKEHAHTLCVFLTIRRIEFFICGVAVAVVVSLNPHCMPLCGIHEQIK